MENAKDFCKCYQLLKVKVPLHHHPSPSSIGRARIWNLAILPMMARLLFDKDNVGSHGGSILNLPISKVHGCQEYRILGAAQLFVMDKYDVAQPIKNGHSHMME